MLSVYFYVPNIIDYLRLVLYLMAWFCFRYPAWFLGFYTVSLVLDYFDGCAARKLHQTSAFGAWLDRAIDNLGRGMLWTQLYTWGYFVSALEWCMFVCTHVAGPQWKSHYSQAPWLVKNVMTENFRSLIGIYAALSLNLLPVWFYVCRFGFYGSADFLPVAVRYFGIVMLSAGRAVYAAVEFYCIWARVQQMVSNDVSQRTSNLAEVKPES